MADSIDKELQTVKSDLDSLNQTVAALARDVKALLSASVSESQGKARANVEDVVQGLKEKLGQVQGQGHKYVESTEERIGEHPFSSLLMAFGIGFILAKMMDLGNRR